MAEYVSLLKRDYNVICVHQRPRSPATNMLDLGVWMATQSVVEKLHFRNRTHVESLWRTCETAWEELETAKISNVYGRWNKVLDLIIEDEGGDRLVEARRGKLFSVPSEISEEAANERTSEDDEPTADKVDAMDHA